MTTQRNTRRRFMKLGAVCAGGLMVAQPADADDEDRKAGAPSAYDYPKPAFKFDKASSKVSRST